MGFISHFLAGGLFNRSEMNKKLDEINDALTPSWKLIDTIDNTVGYSGTWTAPDVFGDGSAYDLGAYMIGGGGSGGLMGLTSTSFYPSGGASGYGKNVVFENIVPGTEYPWVVGQKGAAVSESVSSYLYVAGNNGGSTSFGGETAEGGSGGNKYGHGTFGGQSPDVLQGTLSDESTVIKTNRRLYGCCETLASEEYYRTASQSPREGQNAFDPTMVTLCAGGSGIGQTILAMPDGTKGGNGAYKSDENVTAGSATGYGNGGGAAAVYKPSAARTVKSGAGSDGVIFLYARKAVNTNA